MINRLDIGSVHYDLDSDMKTYLTDCMSVLDKYMPRHARKSAHMEIKLKGPQGRGKKLYECEAIIFMPQSTIAVHEVDDDMRVAIDKAQIRLKQQIHRYKDKHSPRHGALKRVFGGDSF